MKEEYSKPITEFNEFKTTDVVTTSGKVGLTPSGWIDKWY
jgi:hypothetical protein